MKSSEWLAKVGLDASAVHKEKVVAQAGQQVWLTTQKDMEGALTPTIRMVKTPEEYQKLVVTSEHAAPMMPDGVQGCHVDNVSGKDADRLRDARSEAVYFVYGKGVMSDEARKEVVDRYFPLQVALGAFQDLEINTGSQFVIDSGVGSYHFGTVKIHQGGQMVVYSNASIVIDNLQKLPANGTPPTNGLQDFNILGKNGPAGGAGTAGTNASSGTNGQNGSCNWAGTACTSGTAGGKGGTGSPGGQGGNGVAGVNAPQTVSFTVASLTGDFVVLGKGGIGGNGGGGGGGGNGGNGGNGGSGTTCVSTSCSGGSGGNGGDGGTGGVGGQGGPGGQGGGVTFTYKLIGSGSVGKQELSSNGGFGGGGGAGGTGGNAGGAGGSAGSPGASGPNGSSGMPGTPSSININPQK